MANEEKNIALAAAKLKSRKRTRPDFTGPQEIVNVTVQAFVDRTYSTSSFEDGEMSNQQSQTFPVHKNHLCHYSPFFDAALNGSFAEASTNTISLSAVKPEVFRMFVNWVYTQALVAAAIPSALEVYFLADRLLIPSLQNAAIDLIETIRVKTDKYRLPSEIFPLVYAKTRVGSLLRKYVVMVSSSLGVGPFQDTDNYPKEMLVDIINYIGKRASAREKLDRLDMVPYHIEEDTDEEEDDRSKRKRTL
ncbi:hypothetical protein VTL71DRAFT_3576 [Oculimacula yallundae]|uniref:BTB domain-containing protein n=1 Tax=Oculimacula yallundae TaxID=86028 RepID=A0ABR4C7J9_9HELO